jgi:hypothetical protein
MAVYKVPQDVEADDKLIGPFSFRQFIYLIIVVVAGGIAYGLSKLFIPLAILPLPVILLFGALALPLRKDQPMEIYLAALISFFLKPHKRLWDADGIESLIEITVPKQVEIQRIKNISRSDAEQRLGYLAELADSRGWAVRGMGVQAPNSAMNTDAYFAAQQTEDILDNSTSVAQDFDHKLEESDIKRRQDMVDRMRQQITAPAPSSIPEPPMPQVPPIINPYNTFTAPQTPLDPVQVLSDSPQVQAIPTPAPVYNPYPNIQQSVIQPLSEQAQTPVQQPVVTTSEKPISPDIMNLATNTDLSIETIAREANRIHEKEDMGEEVVISLR